MARMEYSNATIPMWEDAEMLDDRERYVTLGNREGERKGRSRQQAASQDKIHAVSNAGIVLL